MAATSSMAAIPEASVDQATPGLKAVALSKLRCQLEELQQHNADLAADNDRLKDKNVAMQQVWCVYLSHLCRQSGTPKAPVLQLAPWPYACMLLLALSQACDESLAKQSALQLAHRQRVSELEGAVHTLKQQVGRLSLASCGALSTAAVLQAYSCPCQPLITLFPDLPPCCACLLLLLLCLLCLLACFLACLLLLLHGQQLADACSNAEEQQGLVSSARQEVNAVLAGRERRCQELRAEVGGPRFTAMTFAVHRLPGSVLSMLPAQWVAAAPQLHHARQVCRTPGQQSERPLLCRWLL